MPRRSQVIQLIYDAIDETNEVLADNRRIVKAEDTILFGESSALDSIGLVTLILATEEAVEESLNTTVTLADEKAMSQKNSPFRTVSTLADYVCSLVLEAQ